MDWSWIKRYLSASFLRPVQPRWSLDQLTCQIADRLYTGRVQPTSDDFSGKIIVVEGLIAAGKTTLVNSAIKTLTAQGYNAIGLDEEVIPEVLNLFYQDMDKYAYSSQLFFTRTRANCNSIAQAHVGRNPTQHPINPDKRSVVFTDRSSIGDATFALIQYLSGRLTNSEWKAVLAAYSNQFSFDVLLFIDVSAERAEYITKKVRCRPNECDIPLSYFEQLREGHYALIKELALRGAPIVYSRCPDTPDVYLGALDALNALLHCPSEELVSRLWQPVGCDYKTELSEVSWRYISEAEVHPHVRAVSLIS